MDEFQCTLSGNESPRQFIEVLQEVLQTAVEEGMLGPIERIVVEYQRQPWLIVQHRNGAEWQITPVRSGWPEDGTSTQWDTDDEDEEPDYR